ncbi:MAG TPA: glycosyltransferase family 4 protein [Vicinamibacterales bacterium]|nr:glycosyltransferase family 4 protein [Vicinamibacterales bacterium]
MSIRTVLVCETQVPFVRGGAELLVQQLVEQLRRRGFETDRVAVPFKWYPKDEILAHAAAWRLLDLSESNGRAVDLLIATKFPTYFARHPRKVCWLVHQHRAAYELAGTLYSDFGHDERDVGLKDRLLALDERMLGECAARYTISRTVTDRLRRYNGLDSMPLYHPPLLADRLTPGDYGPYVLSVARLEGNKRVDLIVRAMAAVPPPLALVVVGEGSHRPHVERAAEEAGVADRVRFAGAVDDDDLVTLYRDALALVYVPYDEDYGLATLEAFLAGKPVVTARDSGGTLEFVHDDVSGLVVEPDIAQLGAAIAALAADRTRVRRLGEAGRAIALPITWDTVIERLVGQA